MRVYNRLGTKINDKEHFAVENMDVDGPKHWQNHGKKIVCT
jgi:hypothetical protein